MRKQAIALAAMLFSFVFIQEVSKAQNPVSTIRLYKETLHQTTDSLNVIYHPDSAGTWYRLVVSIQLSDSINADSATIDSLSMVIKDLDSAAMVVGSAHFGYYSQGQFPNNKSYIRDQNMLYFTLGDFVLTMPVFVEAIIITSAPNITTLSYTAYE